MPVGLLRSAAHSCEFWPITVAYAQSQTFVQSRTGRKALGNNANGNAKYSIPQIEDSLETDFVVPTKSWPNGTLLHNCSIESGAYDYLISLTLRGTCLGHEIADEV